MRPWLRRFRLFGVVIAAILIPGNVAGRNTPAPHDRNQQMREVPGVTLTRRDDLADGARADTSTASICERIGHPVAQRDHTLDQRPVRRRRRHL